MSKPRRVMKYAHLLWADFKTGRRGMKATRSDFAFFLKCAWCYERMGRM